MVAILHFFSSNAVFIYLLLAIGLAVVLRQLARAGAERHEAVFGLEREMARRHTNAAAAGLVIVLAAAIGELIVIAFLSPILPALSLIPTPTENPLSTQTITLPADILATLNMTTPTVTATASAQGCIPGQIGISSPTPGQVISGMVDISGTANVPNFSWYKYEYSVSGSNVWDSIMVRTNVVNNGPLGQWDTSLLSPGSYELRLVVVDNAGNSLPACVVPVQVQAP
jgi:hypothetical protein